ncbi:hypothetical protein XIS1_1800052 [Xenorhabdus innexi]|uniref:Uncharacterized protein n=1 Tax=Xenorhabdus innexi TaxID=290109 RepID=A0A1N6MX63_9GAMM|nr:hypothetical protein XIS1_1800052 [Xenorhabdus innexi]
MKCRPFSQTYKLDLLSIQSALTASLQSSFVCLNQYSLPASLGLI